MNEASSRPTAMGAGRAKRRMGAGPAKRWLRAAFPMKGGSGPSVLLGLVAVGLAALACKAGSSTIDHGRLEKAMTDHLKGQGVAVDKVECPPDQPKKAGHAFECTAQCHGSALKMAVTVKDDKGNLAFKPKNHTFTTDQVEAEVKKQLAAKGHKVSKIDCHGKLWIATKDATHTCDVTDEAGTNYLYSATFSGEGGKHTFSLKKK